jgi:hypothetical protein
MSAFPYFYGITLIPILIILGLQVGLSFIGASMASKKGYSFGGFWCLGFFSSFLIGIIAAAIVPNLNRFVTKEEYYARPPVMPQSMPTAKPCPNCGRGLNDETFCPSCGTKTL